MSCRFSPKCLLDEDQIEEAPQGVDATQATLHRRRAREIRASRQQRPPRRGDGCESVSDSRIMKPAAEWDERHILGIPSGELDWVEFKSSRALDVTVPGVKESEVRNELSKQLSAFSNSSGGTLVYGISDPVPGQPLKVDSGGVSLRCKGKSTKEWLEDVIPNLVEFTLRRFNVHVVEARQRESQISTGKALFLIEIPDSEQAPHQASDKRYYARIGGKSVPIGHRFVTDIIGRAQYPKLEAVFGLSKAEETEELLLHVYVRNVGRIFANYVNGEILIPLGLFPAEQEADHEIVSKEGWRYYRIYFDNVHKDVVGVSGNAHYARAYTVGRYDPVLPSQGFSVNTGVKMTELKRHDFLGKDLHWEVFADNAPPRSGRIAIGAVKRLDARSE